jgi:hypothetical protein
VAMASCATLAPWLQSQLAPRMEIYALLDIAAVFSSRVRRNALVGTTSLTLAKVPV